MTAAWATAAGVSALAHGVHLAIVVGGLVGIGALLAPQLAERVSPTGRRELRSEHDVRVEMLRSALADGTLRTPARDADVSALVAPARPAGTVPGLLLPAAVVASACAAGVHAALGPAHFREQLVFGLFFALSSILQLAWTALALQRATPALLLAGALGNAACVALWALTRTAGLPGGLMPSPEAVGPWDLAAVTWELVVVVGCLAALARSSYAVRIAPWGRWRPAAHGFFTVSVAVLLLLSLSGWA